MPVRAGGKVPTKIGAEDFLAIALGEIGRPEERCTGDARTAGVITQRKMDLVGVGKGVAEVSAVGAIEESVVGALAFGREIRSRAGVIEFAEEAADLRPTAAAGEATPFGEDGDFGYAGF